MNETSGTCVVNISWLFICKNLRYFVRKSDIQVQITNTKCLEDWYPEFVDIEYASHDGWVQKGTFQCFVIDGNRGIGMP